MRKWITMPNLILAAAVMAGYYVGQRYNVQVLVKKEGK